MDTFRASTTWDVVPLGLFPLLAELAVKAAIVVLAASLLAWCFRRRSAASRHVVWVGAFALLCALPAVVLLAPDWRVVPDARVGAPAPASVKVVRRGGAPIGSFVMRGASGGTELSRRRALRQLPLGTAPKWTLTRGLATLWAAGLLLIALRYAVGTLGVRRWTRGARALDAEHAWQDARAHAEASTGPTPNVRLLEVPAADVPLVWGVRRPVVLLPPSARDWSDERRAMVLMHELAHVRRGDVLVEALVQLACALYWFHPAVWLAARRLRLERERACDDRVIESGARPSSYATHLLAIVDEVADRRPPPIVALCVARLEDFDARMATLLGANAVRRASTPRLRLAVAGGAVATLLLLGPLAPERPMLRAGSVPEKASMVFVQAPGGGLQLEFVGSDADARRLLDSLHRARGGSPKPHAP